MLGIKKKNCNFESRQKLSIYILKSQLVIVTEYIDGRCGILNKIHCFIVLPRKSCPMIMLLLIDNK